MWDLACTTTDGPVDRTPPPVLVPDWVNEGTRAVLDPQGVYALQVAEEAWQQARLGVVDPERVGIVGSLVYGGFQSLLAQDHLLRTQGEDAVSGYLTLHASKIAGTTLIAHSLGIQGHTKVVTGACATGAYAIGDGLDLIRSGRLDVVVIAGAQAPPVDVIFASYRSLGALSPSGWVRPFDRRRDGFMPAAGGAALVLESEDHARRRGATILAELRGAGNTIDASLLPSASGSAPGACLRGAFRDAGYQATAIRQVSAHGTGTRKNDEFEARMLHEVFGGAVPPVTAPKRALGHPFGATGVQAGVLAVESIVRGVIPPVGVDVEPDPACDVPIVIGDPMPWEPGPVLTLAYGLGGHNGALIFSPWSSDEDAFS
jgi:3-oxoacyl-[acyl-carrier-protein] synthase II